MFQGPPEDPPPPLSLSTAMIHTQACENDPEFRMEMEVIAFNLAMDPNVRFCACLCVCGLVRWWIGG